MNLQVPRDSTPMIASLLWSESGKPRLPSQIYKAQQKFVIPRKIKRGMWKHDIEHEAGNKKVGNFSRHAKYKMKMKRWRVWTLLRRKSICGDGSVSSSYHERQCLRWSWVDSSLSTLAETWRRTENLHRHCTERTKLYCCLSWWWYCHCQDDCDSFDYDSQSSSSV